jgi:hypothetical protein
MSRPMSSRPFQRQRLFPRDWLSTQQPIMVAVNRQSLRIPASAGECGYLNLAPGPRRKVTTEKEDTDLQADLKKHRGGSDGTRTRDLRRDRPLRACGRLVTSGRREARRHLSPSSLSRALTRAGTGLPARALPERALAARAASRPGQSRYVDGAELAAGEGGDRSLGGDGQGTGDRAGAVRSVRCGNVSHRPDGTVLAASDPRSG